MLQANHLIGFGVGGGFSQLSFSFSDTSPDSGITTPNPGDLMVVFGIDAPDGFTVLIGSNPNISYKISDGTETSLSSPGILIVFSGNESISTVVDNDGDSEETEGNPAPQTVTSGSGVPPLLVLGAYFTDGGAVNPRSFSPAKDGEVNASLSGADAWLAYKIYNASPDDVTVDMDDEGSGNRLFSIYLELS